MESSVDAIVDAIGDMVIEYVQVDAIPDSPDVASPAPMRRLKRRRS